MAMINEQNCPNGLRASCSRDGSGPVILSATQETIDQLGEKTRGYVHVFDRGNPWSHRCADEWLCHEKVAPIAVYTVCLADLSQQIERLVPVSVAQQQH